jgi:hypothetical protein
LLRRGRRERKSRSVGWIESTELIAKEGRERGGKKGERKREREKDGDSGVGVGGGGDAARRCSVKPQFPRQRRCQHPSAASFPNGQSINRRARTGFGGRVAKVVDEAALKETATATMTMTMTEAIREGERETE